MTTTHASGHPSSLPEIADFRNTDGSYVTLSGPEKMTWGKPRRVRNTYAVRYGVKDGCAYGGCGLHKTLADGWDSFNCAVVKARELASVVALESAVRALCPPVCASCGRDDGFAGCEECADHDHGPSNTTVSS